MHGRGSRRNSGQSFGSDGRAVNVWRTSGRRWAPSDEAWPARYQRSAGENSLFLYDGSGCHAAGIFPVASEIRNSHRGSARLTRGSGRMKMKNTLGLSFLAALAAALCGAPAQAQQAPMTFFVTSVDWPPLSGPGGM